MRLAITQKRSAIGRSRKQRNTILALGLRRLHQTVFHDDTPQIRGMISKVIHLVEVDEAISHPDSQK